MPLSTIERLDVSDGFPYLIADGKYHPSEAFARALIDHCGTTGPVFVYNAGFENGVMRGLAGSFPHLSPGLLAIVDRVVDLLPIARNRYYHPSQHGSWSIKAVLPAVCPDLLNARNQRIRDWSEIHLPV